MLAVSLCPAQTTGGLSNLCPVDHRVSSIASGQVRLRGAQGKGGLTGLCLEAGRT